MNRRTLHSNRFFSVTYDDGPATRETWMRSLRFWLVSLIAVVLVLVSS